jgi:hypothetical protein
MNGRQFLRGLDARRPPGVEFDLRAQEVSPLSAAPSGVPLFVGLARRAPFTIAAGPHAHGPDVHRFTRWEQFAGAYGERVTDWLACAVRGFFENGGRVCHVLLVGTGIDEHEWNDAQATRLADALCEPFREGGLLESFDDADLICVPDAMHERVALSVDPVIRIQTAVVAHCGRMGDRFAILDAFAGSPDAGFVDPRDPAAGPIAQWQSLPPAHGAIYFPWIQVHGLGHALSDRFVPPCGHVAGVYARSDRREGPHKPPANELLEGVVDLGMSIDDHTLATLNEAGVNCLCESAGWGIRVWGARTLSDRPAWMYVNATRVMLAFKRWLEQDLRDVVFEPNSPVLWTFIAERIEHRCEALFRHGALKGQTARQAWFVKCDAETNAQFDGDSGMVIADIGLAPAAPAEFVVVRLTQSADRVTASVPAFL